jgi:molybdate transport system substrate-binding protein
MRSIFLRSLVCCALPLIWINQSLAAEVSVAVAANFSAPMKVIAQAFERETGHKAVLSFGATGQLYAQIRNGAPFSILLAADEVTPAKIGKEGLGVTGTTFTYAIGQLVLWSKNPGRVDEQGEILKKGSFTKLAIANPKLAPYGAAAIEVLNHLGVMHQVKPKIVEGANIAQTFQFVFSENAELGFVALSQVYENGKLKQGSGWLVPTSLYSPIKQDAILLNSGRDNPAARALMQYLQSDAAKRVIQNFGYEIKI